MFSSGKSPVDTLDEICFIVFIKFPRQILSILELDISECYFFSFCRYIDPFCFIQLSELFTSFSMFKEDLLINSVNFLSTHSCHPVISLATTCLTSSLLVSSGR